MHHSLRHGSLSIPEETTTDHTPPSFHTPHLTSHISSFEHLCYQDSHHLIVTYFSVLQTAAPTLEFSVTNYNHISFLRKIFIFRMIVSTSRVTFFVGIEVSMDQRWVGAIDATAETCMAVTQMECHLTLDHWHAQIIYIWHETIGSGIVLVHATWECCSGWKRDVRCYTKCETSDKKVYLRYYVTKWW
jgi:hypothetical protein